MSDLERNLRDALDRRAGATPTSPGDWQDLTARMARRNLRTKRLMAGALALVLIIGPLAGFAVARSIDDGDSSGEISAGGPASATERFASDSSAVSANLLALSGQSSGSSTLERLFRRTTHDGIQVRGYTSRVHDLCEGTDCPPAACLPDAQIVGQLSTEAAVGYAIGGHFATEPPDIKVTGVGFFGANGEGFPVEWTIAQTSDRVAKVRMTFLDGATDEMAPAGGVVILAAPSEPNRPGGTLEAFDASGTLVGHTPVPVLARLKSEATAHSATNTFSIQQSASASSGSGRASASSSVSGSSSSSASSSTTDPCAAPVPTPATPTVPTRPTTSSLPSPGAQPADPAAARAEIEQAFATSYDGGVGDTPEKRAVVEDPSVLGAAMDQISKGPYAGHVADSDAKVNGIVFTSPTEATVRYEIDIVSSTNFTGRIGQAKLIDGRWKVTRDTTCNDIALSGVTCAAR
jgi:hypothetical protein